MPDLAALSGEEKDELAHVYLDLLKRLDALYPTPTPYISAWHQAPLDDLLRPASYLHLQLTSPRRAADKLKYLAGSEAAMGAFINDTTPRAWRNGCAPSPSRRPPPPPRPSPWGPTKEPTHERRTDRCQAPPSAADLAARSSGRSAACRTASGRHRAAST